MPEETTQSGHSTSDDSDSHDGSRYQFRLFQFQEIKCTAGEKGMPKPRSGHRIFLYKGRVYSFGGYNPATQLDDPDLLEDEYWVESKPLFKELWELNLTTGRWTKCEMKGDMPEALYGHTAVRHPLDPGLMLIYGGVGANFTTSNTVVSCHIQTQQFKELVTQEGKGKPMALWGQAVVTHNKGLLYTVGGVNESHYFYMDVDVLDLRSSPPVWSSLYRSSGVRDEPELRFGHELCLWEGKLFVLGMRLVDLPTFDIEEKRWFYTRTEADHHATEDNNSYNGYPKARALHRTVQIGKLVWVFGGYNGNYAFGDAWQLNMSTMQWTRLRMELPLPVYSHAMTVSDEGQVVMFGGVVDTEQNTRIDRVYTAWLRVPSLRSLTWEAVCYYQPSISTMSLTTLLEEGVPKDFVELLGSNVTSQAGDQ